MDARRWMGARRSLPREVYVLGLVAFCVAVGFGVLVPVLPVFARSFGVGNTEVGAVISAFALMRLISSPFCGWLIKIFSERIIMATGIFIVAISSGLAGISRSYPQLLVLRGVGGIGSAMFTVSAFTLLLTSVEAGVRGRAAGFFQAGFLIGGITGPAVGGALAAISLTAPFFFYAGTLAVAGTVGLVLLRRRSVKPDEGNRRLEGAVSRRRTRRSLSGCVLHQPRPGLDLVRSPVVTRSPYWSWSCCIARRPGPASRSPAPPWPRPSPSARPAIHRHGGPSACHDPRRHRRGGIDHGGAVRTEHLAVDRRALRVRHRLSVPRHRPAAAVGDAAGTSERHGSRGVLDVLGHRGDHRAAGRRLAGRHVVVSGRLRGRCGADAPGSWTVVADAPGARSWVG